MSNAAHHIFLFFYMLIVWKMGERGLIEFYQRYRRISNSAGFQVEDNPAMDLLSSVAIDVANVDVSAFMSYVKVALTGVQKMVNAYSNTPLVYPLYLLFRPNELERTQALLGLRSTLHLVSSDQFEIMGSIAFSFDDETYSRIAGKVLLIKDGIAKARIVKVTSKMVQGGTLPIGAYRLQLPSAVGGEYQSVDYHVVIGRDENLLDCSYIRKHASALADQQIHLGGLYGVFCSLAVDVSTGRLLIRLVNEAPHVYFKDQVYAHVTVKNAQGATVYHREMLGENNALFSDEVPIAPNFSIEILHKEPSRLTVPNSSASAVIDQGAQINTLKVTVQGLVNESLGTRADENLQHEMQRTAELFERSPHLVLHNEFPLKEDFKRAINTFSEPARSELFERYRTLEFFPPDPARTISGDRMKWSLEGNGGRALGSITFDLNERTVRWVFAGAVPHEYFASVYMAVVLRSQTGEVRYLREFRGNVLAQSETSVLPLGLGDTLSVMHREPSRNGIEVNSNGRQIPVGLVQHATYSSLGILTLSSYWPASQEEPGAQP